MREHRGEGGAVRSGRFWLLILTLLLFVACQEDNPGGGGGNGADDDDDDVANIEPGSIGGSAVLAAHEAGQLTDGEAALALYRIFFGLVDDVDLELLAEPGDPEAVHLFLWGLDPDTFSESEREALTALEATVFGQTRDDSVPEGAFDWCRYALADVGYVEIFAPTVAPQAEENCLDGNVLPNAAAVMDTAVSAAQAANPMYRAAFEQFAGEREVYLIEASPADWGSTYGLAVFHSPEYCRTYVTAEPVVVDLHMTAENEVLGAVIHELFHCAQRQKGMNMNNWWVREGTAVWAEDKVGDAHFEHVDTEHRYAERFFNEGPFLSRDYDAVNPIIQLSEITGRDLGYELVAAPDPVSVLTGIDQFPNRWHQISVTTWNESPASIWTNDGRALASGSLATISLDEDESHTQQVLGLDPLGYGRDGFELSDDVEIVEVEIVELPSDGRISLIVETDAVYEMVQDEKRVVCIEAVGQCHETEPVDATLLGLITTNTHASQPLDTEVLVESFAPQLHGDWRTLSVVMSADGQNVQTGSVVTFDEEPSPDEFSESFAGAVVYSWLNNCTVAGSAAGTVVSEYTDTGEETAFGNTTLTPTSGGPTYSCEDGAISGAAPGLWATTQGPWGPGTFDLVGDSLTVTSQAVGGHHWTVTLERI